MPSLQFLFSESLWNLREFLKTPRKIHAVFPAITIFAFWRIVAEYRKALDYVPEQGESTVAIFSIATMVFAFITCYVGSALIKTSKPRFWLAKYLLTIGIAVCPIDLFYLIAFERPYLDTAVAFFRLVVLVGVTESIAGFLISQAQKRSQELESHQKSLIVSEEKFRSLVSTHLHDNLQTRLVAIGIQLNQIQGSLDAENSSKIRAVIDDIENVRAQEVRDFSKEITPNFQVDGLKSSLQRLFSTYKDVISCQLHNMEVIESDDRGEQVYSLGIYRIVEQAMLNSLAHGRATKFDVNAQISNNEILLKISNNGITYEPHNSVEGHGFAVIDAWVTKFDGSWNISNYEEQVVIELRWKF